MTSSPASDATFVEERRVLLAEIADDARRTAGYTAREIFSNKVMRAMETVPRHAFVGETEQELAYVNAPLPIGRGQTISQPFIVALMTDLLEPRETDRVLEVGTGSGYQAAILATLVNHVYSVEIVAELADQASESLASLGYTNVSVRKADGYHGWAEQAPFDSIIVTAAAPSVPEPLLKQLKPGARLVIPIGDRWAGQVLLLIEKRADGELHETPVLPVAFVPMTGKH